MKLTYEIFIKHINKKLVKLRTIKTVTSDEVPVFLYSQVEEVIGRDFDLTKKKFKQWFEAEVVNKYHGEATPIFYVHSL